MKKIIFAIAIVLTIGLTANAQSDGFFRSNYDNSYGNRDGDGLPRVPDYNQNNGYYNTTDVPAPLGTGLLIMTALGAGYAMAKRRKK